MNDPRGHRAVMVAEVVELLGAVPTGLVVDGTVGGAGHARMLLEARPDIRLLGIDRDEEAVAAARERLSGFGERAAVVHGCFAEIDRLTQQYRDAEQYRDAAEYADGTRPGAAEQDHAPATGGRAPRAVVGVLLDLGVSSVQLERSERGFSYRRDGPLDMRMDRSLPTTAADLVNGLPERELAGLVRRYGEERHARAIARRIIARRPLRSTGELAAVISDAVPARARRRAHPARRTFQALRMAVNDELAQLDLGLDTALRVLAPRGRIVVLSYHSLEDRIVKRRFRDWATGGLHPPGMPTPTSERGGVVRLLTPRPLRPRSEEVAVNRRADSARLRAVERLPGAEVDAAGPERMSRERREPTRREAA